MIKEFPLIRMSIELMIRKEIPPPWGVGFMWELLLFGVENNFFGEFAINILRKL